LVEEGSTPGGSICYTRVMNPRLRIGGVFDHPEDGPVRIESGVYTIGGRVSNFWHWTVLATGEEKNGYGGPWEDISDQYVTITIPKVTLRL